jgi:hypothetical protein
MRMHLHSKVHTRFINYVHPSPALARTTSLNAYNSAVSILVISVKKAYAVRQHVFIDHCAMPLRSKFSLVVIYTKSKFILLVTRNIGYSRHNYIGRRYELEQDVSYDIYYVCYPV